MSDYDRLAAMSDAVALSVREEPVTVLAWGASAPGERAEYVREMLARRSRENGTRLGVLGWTQSRQPRHPLYVRADTAFVPILADNGGTNE